MKSIIFLVLLISGTVMASDLSIEFTPPTERENGEELTADEISHYDLRCFEVVERVPENTEYFSTNVPPQVEGASGEFTVRMGELFPEYGSYNCELATVDTDGLYSEYVMVQNGPIEYIPSKPKSPTGVILLSH